MTYVRTNWVNDQTPLNADNMNNIESGIEQALAQGGGSKLYEHNISLSGNNYASAYITIINRNSAIMSLSDIKLSVQNIKKSASGSVYLATFKYVTIKYILANNNTLTLHYFFATDTGGVGYGEASLDNATITDTVVEL